MLFVMRLLESKEHNFALHLPDFHGMTVALVSAHLLCLLGS
jgi:hypothetical protein